MNMIGGDRGIEYAKAKAFLHLEHPMQVTGDGRVQTLIKIFFDDNGE
jgi:hypothetical protein